MIKVIFMWVALAAAFAWVIKTVNRMAGKDIWSATKTLTFGAICGTLALVVLFIIVLLY